MAEHAPSNTGPVGDCEYVLAQRWMCWLTKVCASHHRPLGMATPRMGAVCGGGGKVFGGALSETWNN